MEDRQFDNPGEAPENREQTPAKKGRKEKKNKPVWREILEWVVTLVVALAAALVIRTFLFEPVKVDGHSMDDTLADQEIMFVGKTEYSSFWACLPQDIFGLKLQTKEAQEASPKFTFFGDPKRFDVVICRYPKRGDTNFVKRVVGIPGDTVEIRDGFLYVNGERYEEPYINNEYRFSSGLSPMNTAQFAEESTLREGVGVLLVRADGTSDLIAFGNDRIKLADGVLSVNGEAVAYDPQSETLLGGYLDSFGPVVVPEGDYFVMGDHRNNSNDSRAQGAIPRSYVIGHVVQVIFPFNAWRAVLNGTDVR